MAWVLLLTAGLLEIVWAFTMKLSHGFTRPGACATRHPNSVACRLLLLSSGAAR